MRSLIFVVISVVIFVACGGSTQPAPAPPMQPHHKPPMTHDHHQHHQHKGPIGHRFEKADDWVPMFDDPKRDEWQQPDKVVAALAIAPGMTVADVGAGTGYFEARLAAAVGPTGRVLAIDVEPDMVRYLGERAKREGTPQVEPLLATADDAKLAPNSVDRIVVVDTWHHVPSRESYAKKLAAALRPGGFVLVVDFTLETRRGPPPTHRLAPEAVRAELEGAGLRVSVVDIGLPDQYVIKGER